MKKIILIFVSIIGISLGISVFAEEECEFKYISGKDFLNIDTDHEYINSINEQYLINMEKYKDNIYIEKNDGKYFVINNGVNSEEYYYIVKLMISFDGNNLAYIVREGNDEYVIYNGNKSKKYSKISLNHLKFSLNGDFVFLGIKDNGDNVLVKNLEEIAEDAFSPRFSYNNDQFGYISKEKGEQAAVVNGKKSRFYYKVRVESIFKDIIIYKIVYDKIPTLYENNVLYDLDGNKLDEYFYLDCKESINFIENGFDNQEKIKLTKQLILSKNNLKNNDKMVEYIEKFDILIPKISQDKLELLNGKISNLSLKIRNNKAYKDILNYIEAKVLLEILKRNEK